MGMRDSFDQGVCAEFAQIIAKGADGILGGLELAGIQNGGVNFLAAPASQRSSSATEQYFQQSCDSDLVQTKTSDFALAQFDRFG